MLNEVTIFWFRRDLRLEDNAGLAQALALGIPVLPIFIFDRNILNRLTDKKDRRVDYIWQAVDLINQGLQLKGSTIKTYYVDPLTVFKQLNEEYNIRAVYFNHDYEPEAIERDKQVKLFFQQFSVPVRSFKDQVIFEGGDIVKTDGKPYTVFTPYANRWKQNLTQRDYIARQNNNDNFWLQSFSPTLSLNEIGFEKTDMVFERPELNEKTIAAYEKYRDYPAVQGTTKLGIALRFGTISIRSCVGFALKHNQTWLSELIWREFFMQVLYHFPHVVHHSFKRQYDNIQWRNNEQDFELWCKGQTGYPLVDAGMRELNETGFMHNRVRMITASFLCKHLLIDWRWGESYFAQKLNDYDLASNNGNWQWAAGSGCDAAPYFRVFNPAIQAKKFDKENRYIQRWVPEWGTDQYTSPIVDHAFARERALNVYSKAVKTYDEQYG